MVFREDGQGRVTDLFFDSHPTWAYVRLAWYQSPAFHAGLLAICVVHFLSAMVLWPVSALRDRGKGKARAPRPSMSRLARWLAGGIAALSVLYLIGYALVLGNPDQAELLYGDPPLLRVVEVLPLPTAVLALSVLAFTITGVDEALLGRGRSGALHPGRGSEAGLHLVPVLLESAGGALVLNATRGTLFPSIQEG